MDIKECVNDEYWRKVLKKIKPEFPGISDDELMEMLGMIYRGRFPEDTTHETVSKVKKEIELKNGKFKLEMAFPDKATIIVKKNEDMVDILEDIRRKVDTFLAYNFETAATLELLQYPIALSDIERYRSYAIDMLVKYNWNKIKKNIDNSKNQKVTIEIVNTLGYTGWMIANLNRKSRVYYEEFMDAYFDGVIDELSDSHYSKEEIEKATKKAYFKDPEFIGDNAKDIAEKVKMQLENK